MNLSSSVKIPVVGILQRWLSDSTPVVVRFESETIGVSEKQAVVTRSANNEVVITIDAAERGFSFQIYVSLSKATSEGFDATQQKPPITPSVADEMIAYHVQMTFDKAYLGLSEMRKVAWDPESAGNAII